MAKQCRSLNRAIKRGHAVDLRTGIYKGRKENTVLRQIWKAALKKQNQQITEGDEDTAE